MKMVWDVDIPKARSTDPETSHEAAASVQNRTETQEAILEAFRLWGPGLTDADIQERYRYVVDAPLASPSGLRTRRAELVKAGRVRDSGQRAVLPSGRRSIVWELVPDGLAEKGL